MLDKLKEQLMIRETAIDFNASFTRKSFLKILIFKLTYYFT